MELIITNARMVLRDEVFHGSLHAVGGQIVSMDHGTATVPGALDLGGDFLLPGFIELHTDNLEKQLEPRPGIFWPDPMTSVVAHDTQMVGAGITTVLDAVSLGEYHDGPRRAEIMDLSLSALRRARRSGVLRADHFTHLRCEYSDPRVLAMFEPHLGDPSLRLVSLMDHTPGQRQFTDPEAYRAYFSKHAWTDEEFEELSLQLKSTQASCAECNRARIVNHCAARSIPLASHDDTLAEHIAQAVAEGVRISEFPTTLEAARLAREAGITIVMGAPNVVRGGSHSGNVAAMTLAEAGCLDILSSDYVPGSLVAAAFKLHTDLGMPLPRAVNTLSANPAAVLGMDDRGEIAPGKRADLVRVRLVEGLPVVLACWCAGQWEQRQ